MKVEGYLKVGATKRHSWMEPAGVAYTKKKPTTKANEVAIKISMELPDSLFQRPELEAKIVVPEESVSAPVIDADVADNIGEILSKELGIQVNVSADEESFELERIAREETGEFS